MERELVRQELFTDDLEQESKILALFKEGKTERPKDKKTFAS